MTFSQRHKIIIAITTAYWLVLAAVTHIPIPNWARKTGFSDKTMHYFAYFILACLLWFAVSPNKKANWRQFRPWLMLLIVILYGILDEAVQGLIGRSADLFDFFADIIGALAGFAVVSLLSLPHAMLLIVIISAFALPMLTKSGLIVSGSLADMGISFAAFLFLTAGWILYKRLTLNLKPGKVYFVITSLLLPVAVLAGVKLFCLCRGTDFGPAAIIAAALGIVTATLTASFFYSISSTTRNPMCG